MANLSDEVSKEMYEESKKIALLLAKEVFKSLMKMLTENMNSQRRQLELQRINTMLNSFVNRLEQNRQQQQQQKKAQQQQQKSPIKQKKSDPISPQKTPVKKAPAPTTPVRSSVLKKLEVNKQKVAQNRTVKRTQTPLKGKGVSRPLQRSLGR